MGSQENQRASKWPLDPEEERWRERVLRDKAQRERHQRGRQQQRDGREGDWGPPAPWWTKQ